MILAKVCYVYRPIARCCFFFACTFCLSVHLRTLLPYLVNEDVHIKTVSKVRNNYMNRRFYDVRDEPLSTCACALNSRNTAVDLLNSRRVRDGRRQHIQHQLDSLRFYDSVPLYDGLRHFTPGAATTTPAATDKTGVNHADSPSPTALPPKQPRHAPKKRLRRVASEPTDCGRAPPRPPRGIWSLAGSGRPSAAPRWPTTAETAGGLRPRHWPPVNDRGGPYWIRLESALTMTKPDDEDNPGDDHDGSFEYRVDVPASEQRRTSSGDLQQQQQHPHGSASTTPYDIYPSHGHVYPGPESFANLHHYVNTGYQYPTDRQPSTEQSYLTGGQRYPTAMHVYPTTSLPGIARDDQTTDVDDAGGCSDVEGAARTSAEDRRHQSYDRRHPRRHRQSHNDSSADVMTTSSGVDPPRYELFTHV